MKKVIVLACVVACGGELAIEGDPSTVAPLPTVPTATASAIATTPPATTSTAIPLEAATIAVNFVEIRKHPEGSRLGLVLAGEPQWRSFATFDLVRDIDWMNVSGALFENDDNDDVVLAHGTSDAQMDAALEAATRKNGGGPVDLHVAGVRAWSATIRGFERVFMRAAPRVIVSVLASRAESVARELVTHAVAQPVFHTDEEMRMRVPHPSTRFSSIPADISEMRVRVDGHPQGGSADIYIEGDCPSSDAALADAATLQAVVQQKNSFIIRLATEGLFNGVVFTTLGNQVHTQIHATQRQIQVILGLIASRSGVTLPPRTP